MQCLVDLYREKISALKSHLRTFSHLSRESTTDLQQFCKRTFTDLSAKKLNKVTRDDSSKRECFAMSLSSYGDFRCFYDPNIPVPVFCQPVLGHHTGDEGPSGRSSIYSSLPPTQVEANTRDASLVDLPTGDRATGKVVLNPFNCRLSATQVHLLNRGLNFCPTSQPNHLNICKSLFDLERKLKLRYHFYKPPEHRSDSPSLAGGTRETSLSAFHKEMPSQSTFIPASFDPAIPAFVRAVREDVDRELGLIPRATVGQLKHNLSPAERHALVSLRKRADIIIKPSDKGHCVVILPVEIYKSKCLEQLSDQKFYEQIPWSHYDTLKLEAQRRIRAIERELDPKVFNYLLMKNPRPGRFYGLVKVHKEGWPLRPIVSANASLTEHCSHLADFLLKGVLPRLDTYIKDSDHFQEKIKQLHVPPDALLVTVDIRSLYTNIPSNAGIQAALRAYRDILPPEEQHVPDGVLQVLLEIVLHYNIFEFDGKLYLQKYGTAMGTKAAPSYASIFLGQFEQCFLASQSNKPLFLGRFLDDLFMVWLHGRRLLESFLHAMDNFHPDIKITYSSSETSVNFLDMTVSKEPDGTLSTTLYRKPTDAPAYLEFFSDHPSHMKRAIPYGIAHRVVRRCTSVPERERNLDIARQHLVSRHYPQQLVEDAFARASVSASFPCPPRRPVDPAESPITNFIVPFSSRNPHFERILNKHVPLLRQNPHLRQVYGERPIRVVYTRAKNLRDILVHSKMPNPGSSTAYSGSGPCNGRSDCRLCTKMKPTNEVVSLDGQFTFQVRGSYNCNSQNIIYMLVCGQCGLQYIGETCRKLRERFNDHKSKSNKRKYPVGRHVVDTGHAFDTFHAIVLKGGFSSDHERKLFESFLIQRFRTVQNGLNDDSGILR
jgi:hypothetical protein